MNTLALKRISLPWEIYPLRRKVLPFNSISRIFWFYVFFKYSTQVKKNLNTDQKFKKFKEGIKKPEHLYSGNVNKV